MTYARKLRFREPAKGRSSYSEEQLLRASDFQDLRILDCSLGLWAVPTRRPHSFTTSSADCSCKSCLSPVVPGAYDADPVKGVRQLLWQQLWQLLSAAADRNRRQTMISWESCWEVDDRSHAVSAAAAAQLAVLAVRTAYKHMHARLSVTMCLFGRLPGACRKCSTSSLPAVLQLAQGEVSLLNLSFTQLFILHD
jgi:hypothetical protein